MKNLHSIAIVMFLLGPANATVLGRDSQATTSGATAQPIIDTNVCEIGASPDSFDGKQLRIHAYLSRQFEDSTLHDPACPEEALINMRAADRLPEIWAEFAEHTDYWKVKGFAPLVKDEQLELFKKTLSERGRLHQMTAGTMIGTFYAGKPIKMNGRVSPLRGYGHMGCCSLFVISHIESTDTDYADELDYYTAEWSMGMPHSCYSEQMLGLPNNETIRSWQQTANGGRDIWRYNPKDVAEEQVKKLKTDTFGTKRGPTTQLLSPDKSHLKAPNDERPTGTLLETKSLPYLKTYEWIEPDRVSRFVVVLSRPYWLAKFAVSPDRVIWVPVGSSLLQCAASGSGSATH